MKAWDAARRFLYNKHILKIHWLHADTLAFISGLGK